MKKLKSSAAIKAIALLLCLVLLAAMVVSAAAIIYLGDLAALPDNYEQGWSNLFRKYSRPYAQNVASQYVFGENNISQHEFLHYRIEENGKTVEQGSYEPNTEYAWHGIFENSYRVSRPQDTEAGTGEIVTDSGEIVAAATPMPVTTAEPQFEHRYVKVWCYLPAGEYTGELGRMINTYNLLYNYRYALMVAAIGCALLAFVLWIFLLSAAGHRKGSEEITERFIDKIPYDLFTAVCVFIGTCGAWLVVEGFYVSDIYYIGSAVVLILLALLVIVWSMSTAVRIKRRELLSNTLCWKILSFCLKPVKKLVCLWLGLMKKLPMVKRAVLILLGAVFVELVFILICGDNTGTRNVLWLIEWFVVFAAAVWVLLCMKELRRAASEIASGNEAARVETKLMRGEFLRHAEDLNNIKAGLNKALAARMKSERFKTELISNVSHDIKTPLTSIINYVDLLSKEQPENEKSREYIDVLQRQAERLKKLTEDLLEASKASSGAIAVNLEPCELWVLLEQTAGEYEERLKNAGLELIVDKGPERVTVMADSRHIWRIFDNLMSNVCKYSLPGSRAYLSLRADDRRAEISLKNISRERLNISPEELTERFVRGDSSRNTEGSGLGLSIAESLTRLQGGDMQLGLDGDLFKVSLVFPRK